MLVTAGVVFAALVVAVGSLAFTVASLRDGKAEVESALGKKDQALTDLQVEKAKADEALANEHRAAYARSLAVAFLASLTGDLDQANAALDERPAEQRHWEWHDLKRLSHRGENLGRVAWLNATNYALTPDGSRFASARAGLVTVVDTRTKQTVFSHKEGPAPRIEPSLSADGRQLAQANRGSVRVWGLTTGKQTHELTGPTVITRAVFQPGGRLLAWGSLLEIRLTDLQTRQEVARLRPAPGAHAWFFTPDGRRLITVLAKGLLGVWDVATGARLHLHQEPFVTAGLAISPDGRLYAVKGPSGVKVCEVDTARVVHSLPTPNRQTSTGDRVALAFGADGKSLAHTTADKTAHLWDLTTGQILRSFPFTREVMSVALVDQSRRLVTVDAEGFVRVRDIASAPRGLRALSPPGRSPSLIGARVISTAFSADGHHAAVGCADGTLRLISVETGRVVREIPKQPTGALGAVAFSPDGQWLATSVYLHPEVTVWSARTGEQLARFKGTTDRIDKLEFSPDGRQLAARHTDRHQKMNHVQVWDTRPWREVFTRSFPERDKRLGLWFAYSPDSQRLAVTVDDDRVRLWSATTGEEERVIREPGCLFSHVGFDPRTGTLAARRDGGAVYLWDGATGQRRNVLRGPSGLTAGFAFSPDGRRLACVTFFPTRHPEVRLWDVTSGRSLLALTEDGAVSSLQFSADGHRLMVASHERGYLQVWDGTPMEPR